jgi:hypothetical protein
MNRRVLLVGALAGVVGVAVGCGGKVERDFDGRATEEAAGTDAGTGGSGGGSSGPGAGAVNFDYDEENQATLQARRYDPERGCYWRRAPIDGLYTEEQFESPNASIGPACVISPEGEAYVAMLNTSAAILKTDSAAEWEVPTWVGWPAYHDYSTFAPEDEALCRAAMDGIAPAGADSGSATTCTDDAAGAPSVSVLLVLDKSGSMQDTPPGYSMNRWEALRAALGSTLSRQQDSLWVGLELFPTTATPGEPIPVNCREPTDRCCEMPADGDMNVNVGPGGEAAAEVMSALQTSSPAGGTPTAVALSRAHDYFADGPGSTLAGERYVLFITDGPPNCNDNLTCDAEKCTINWSVCDGDGLPCCNPEGPSCCDDAPGACLDDAATIAQVQALHGLGIRTVVVAMVWSELYADLLPLEEFFDELALAGGHPNPDGPHAYYEATAEGGEAELQLTLDAIFASFIP